MTHLEPLHQVAEPDLAEAGGIFRSRGFVTLWSAQVLSQLASNMVLAALIAVVYGSTGSNTANAILILTFLLPAVLFSAIAGVIVERADARLIMLGANLLRVASILQFAQLFGVDAGLTYYHDYSSPVLFLLAFSLLILFGRAVRCSEIRFA